MTRNQGLASVRQKERLVAALRPAPVGALVSPAAPLLAQLKPLTHTPATRWIHGFARLDASGRVRDAAVFAALGWKAGDVLSVRMGDERALVERGGGCGVKLDSRGRLCLSETVRRRLSLSESDGVVISADVEAGVLILTPARRCDLLVSA